MIKPVLLASATLLSGLPGVGVTAPTPAPVHLILAASGPNLHAAADDWRTDALQALDVTIEDSGGKSSGERAVTATADRAKLRSVLPALREHGVVPRGLTLEEAERRPAFAANLLCRVLTSWVVRDAYATDSDLDITRWRLVLLPEAAAGRAADTGTQEMFSFVMDRKRYERTDWDTLTPAAFPAAAAGFSYNLRFALEMSREVGGGIDDD